MGVKFYPNKGIVRLPHMSGAAGLAMDANSGRVKRRHERQQRFRAVWTGYQAVILAFLRLCISAKWWRENGGAILPRNKDDNDATARMNAGRWT